MRNRKLAILLIAGASALSGCGLFQSVEKQKDSAQLKDKSSFQQATTNVDTSSTFSKRSYFGTTPEIQAAYLKSFEMSMNAANSAASAAMLKGKSEDVSTALNSMSLYSGRLFDLLNSGVLGYDETSITKNGINTSSTTDEQRETGSKEESSWKEKKPDVGALLVGGGVLLLIILVLVVYVVRLSKKVNGLVSIFNGKLTL